MSYNKIQFPSRLIKEKDKKKKKETCFFNMMKKKTVFAVIESFIESRFSLKKKPEQISINCIFIQ